MKKTVYIAVLVLIAIGVVFPLLADTGKINYQARILDSYGRRMNGTVDLSFKIYDAVTDGNLLWSETQTDVTVQDGVYSVILGSGTPIPSSIFTQDDIYLELGINGETMSPRQQITASAYSLVARTIMGSNVYENQTSGYLGVGTTNPVAKLDVDGTVNMLGFKMPTGATANYILASDENGVGTWQPYSVVVTEHDPIHTNWVRVVYTPATNSIWGAIGAEATTRANADTALQNNIDTSSNALQTQATALQGATNSLNTRAGNLEASTNALNTTRVLRAGDTMTGPLTNLVGFVGNGAGLTNIPSSGVVLTGYVQRIGDTMTGPLVISNNLTVALTNEAGDFVATNSISLRGSVITNWDNLTGTLTVAVANLNASTNTLNTATNVLQTQATALQEATNTLNTATNALQTQATALQGATNTLNTATNALQTQATALQEATNTLNTATNVLQTQVTALQGATNTLNTATNVLQTQATALQEATNTLNTATNVLQTQVTALQEATNTLNTATNVLQTQVTALQEATNTLNTATNALQTQATALQGATNTLNARAVRWDNAIVCKEGSGTVAYSNLYYLASGTAWSNANANTTNTAEGLLGLALGSSVSSSGLLLNGCFSNHWGFTPGTIIYMDTNNNAVTAVKPNGTNNVVRILGYTISSTNIYFNPDRTYIEILGE